MQKGKRRWLSMLLSTSMVLSSLVIPAAAAEQDPAELIVQETTERAGGAQETRTVDFNKEWKFALKDQSGAQAAEYDDSSWENVTLPHDFSIIQEFSNENEGESGFLPGGIGWYRKSVTFPADYAGKNIVLNFDGVYNYADVYVNGTKVGENRYGYTSFAFDISNLVTCDGTTKNVIAVKAENKIPSSRWYSGSGIYRDVTLEVTGKVHVALDGTYVTTPDLEKDQKGNAKVNVVTKVENDTDASVNAKVRTTIVDARGTAASTPVENDVTVEKAAEKEVTQVPTVSSPALWDCDNPNLYYVKTEILVNNEVTDTYMTEFGFRYIKYDANTGFSLNGKNTKLKGVCMHHDQGALGSAAYYDAIYRQVEILKEMGCNAIRTSHNTPAEALIKACNELGMLIQDEVFDGWTHSKNGNSNDFGVYFNKTLGADNQIIGGTADKTWAQFAIESTFKRDRNAPCVIMWSIGNELPTGASGNMSTEYPQIADNLIRWMQENDATRPITMGDNNANFGSSDFRTVIDTKIAAAGGVVGLNYSNGGYQSNHDRQPTWPLVATETASPSNSRGIYDTLSHYSKPGNYQCTSYDTDCVSWGDTARDAWWNIIKYDFMSGEFIWTGFDYIGEPTPWNGINAGSSSGDAKAIPNSSYFGVIDTAGFPKDSFYYYTSQWREDKTTLHVVPQSWNQEDLIPGGIIPVSIYSNAAKVELYLNDKLIGTSTRIPVTTQAGHVYATYTNKSENANLCQAVAATGYTAMAAEYKVNYEKGTLSTKAYNDKGELITDTLGLSSVTTNSDKGSVLKMEAEKTEIQADGSSLCYISVDVEDKDGNFVSAARNNIRFNLTGNGTIVGVDNGNPSTVDKFQQKSVLTSDKTANIDAFSGKALVIVRSTNASGGFTMRADSAELGTAKVDVDTVNGTESVPYVKDYTFETNYSVEMGTIPEFPSSVQVTMSDGTDKNGTIVWDSVEQDIYNTPGDYVIHGVLTAEGTEIPVTAYLHVKAKIVAMQNYSRATSAGIVPKLPDTLDGVLPDGRLYDGNYSITWDALTEAQLETVGTIVTVQGTAQLEDGTMPVTATVRVAEGVTLEEKNVAPTRKTLTENCSPTSDNLQSITDGSYEGASSPNNRWTNWNSHLLNSEPTITFTWDEIQLLDHVDLYYFVDASVGMPEKTSFSVTSNDKDYVAVTATASDQKAINANCNMIRYQFSDAVKANGMKIAIKEVGTGYVGLTECEIYTSAMGYTVNKTAVLETLTLDGKTVDGFNAGEINPDGYTITTGTASSVVAATAKDNASVTIVPQNEAGEIRVIVQSEDHALTNVYLLSRPATDEEKADLKAAIVEIKKLKEEDYTADTWSVLQAALEKAERAAAADSAASVKEIENTLAELQAAEKQLYTKAQELADQKAELQKLCEELDKIDEEAYTAESYQNMKNKLEAAKSILKNDGATIDNVKSALSELQTAKAELIQNKTAITAPDIQAQIPAKGDYTKSAELLEKDNSTHNTTLADRIAPAATLDEAETNISFDGKWAYSGRLTAANAGTNNEKFDFYGKTPYMIRFSMKIDTLPEEDITQNIIGKMDEQYGIQVENDCLIYYMKDANNKWPEVKYNFDSSFAGKWHDVMIVYTGAKMQMYVDGNLGTPTAERVNADPSYEVVPGHSAASVFTIGYNTAKAATTYYTGLLADTAIFTGTDFTNGLENDIEVIRNYADSAEPIFALDVTPYTAVTSWYDGDTKLAADAVFEQGKKYTMKVVLTADDEHIFNADSKPAAITLSDKTTVKPDVTVSDNGSSMTIAYTFPAVPEPACICEITSLNFAGSSIDLAATDAEKNVNLTATAVTGGECRVDGHKAAEVVYTYSVEDAGTTGAAIEGNVLTVKEAGTAVVKVKAQYNNAVMEATAEFIVKSQKATAEDKEELQGVITAQEKLNEQDYTEDTWKTYKEALDAAKKIMENPTASKEEVAQAKDNLVNAASGLKTKEDELQKQIAAEKEALRAVCAGVQNTDPAKYTKESYDAFKTAYDAALAVCDKADATLEEVQAARAALEAARDGLKPQDTTVQPAKLDAPTIKSLKSKLTKKGSSVQITVNTVANAETYTVYRKVGTKVLTIGTTAAGKTTVTDKKPVSGKSAGYYAVANGKSVQSEAGAVKSIKLPKATKKVTAKKTGAAVRVSWKKVKKASGYYVFRSTKKGSGYVKVGKASSRKNYYLDKKAKAGKKYYYKVVTKAKTGFSNLSKPSKVIKVTK